MQIDNETLTEAEGVEKEWQVDQGCATAEDIRRVVDEALLSEEFFCEDKNKEGVKSKLLTDEELERLKRYFENCDKPSASAPLSWRAFGYMND